MKILPAEISEHIFSYVPAESLSVAALVCKAWCSLATPVLYDTVVVCSDKALAAFARTATSPRIAGYVRHVLCIKDYSDWRWESSTTEYLQLAQLLCNVKSVIAHYVELRTQESAADTRMKHVAALDATRQWHDTMETAGSVVILQNEEAIRMGVTEYLKLFPHLKRLNIDFKERLVSPDKTFTDLMEQCSTLDALSFGPEMADDCLLTSTRYMSSLAVHVLLTSASLASCMNYATRSVNVLKLTVTTYDRDLLPEMMRAFKDTRTDIQLCMPTLTLEDVKSAVAACPWLSHIRIVYSSDPSATPAFTYSLAMEDYEEYFTLVLNGDCFPDLSLSYVFSDYAHYEEGLEIVRPPAAVHTHEISTLFPLLSNLSVDGELIVDSATNQDHRLGALTLDSACMDDQLTVDVLAQVYPRLWSLTILNASAKNKNGPTTIELPWIDLHVFHLNTNGVAGEALLRCKEAPDHYWTYSEGRWVYQSGRTDADVVDYVQEQPVVIYEVNCWNDWTAWQIEFG